MSYSVFDAGLDLNIARSITGSSNRTAARVHEHGKIRFFSSHGTSAADHFSPLCRSLRWGAQGQALHLSRSVSVHGLCVTDLSGESARHRSLSAQSGDQAVPHGFSQHGGAEHAVQRERSKGLAYLCRLRPEPDQHCAASVCGRDLRCRSGQHGLCSGCNDHRPVPVGFPVGAIPFDQGSGADDYWP